MTEVILILCWFYRAAQILCTFCPVSSQTNAPYDGVCNFSSIECEEDVDEIEEVFMSINEEVDRGVKQKRIVEI